MYCVVRNSQQYGPYDNAILKSYVEDGRILLCDKAYYLTSPSDIKTVRQILKESGLKVKIQEKGNVFSQLKLVGKELIIPDYIFSKKSLLSDKRLLILAIIGLSPAFLIKFTMVPFLTYYAIATYFSVIWGLFYYYLFKTEQVIIKQTISIYFFTQATIFFLFSIINIQSLPGISQIYSLATQDNYLARLIGFTLGVGFLEESTKALPLLFILLRTKEPIIPQTLLFYGLVSGISFGVFEGVQYQMTVNSQLGYDAAFFMNIARLTSLPFLHSIWAGISGYFLSFAFLYPRYKSSLFIIAIGIPAVLHGLYNTFGWSILGLTVTVLGVVLLMGYLSHGVNYQSKLSK